MTCRRYRGVDRLAISTGHLDRKRLAANEVHQPAGLDMEVLDPQLALAALKSAHGTGTYAVFLGAHDDGTVDIMSAGRKMHVAASPSLDVSRLAPGQSPVDVPPHPFP